MLAKLFLIRYFQIWRNQNLAPHMIFHFLHKNFAHLKNHLNFRKNCRKFVVFAQNWYFQTASKMNQFQQARKSIFPIELYLKENFHINLNFIQKYWNWRKIPNFDFHSQNYFGSFLKVNFHNFNNFLQNFDHFAMKIRYYYLGSFFDL